MFTWLISETLLTVFSVRDQTWKSETIQTATHWDNSKPLGQTNLLLYIYRPLEEGRDF